MFSRTVCAASILAAFALGTTSVALAQEQSRPNRQRPPAERHTPHVEAHPGRYVPIVVTANDMPTPVDQLVSDVIVIPTRRGTQNLYQTESYQTIGGVQTFSRGTPGSDSGIAIRGQSQADTLVLIDGFRVTSASGTDFSLLPLNYGSRTEVLRGPASAVHGSNAGGGVIQLLSDAADTKVRYSGEAGIGGRGYMQMRGRASGGNDMITGRVEFGREVGDGFDVTTSDYAGHQNDQDTWKRENVSGRLDAHLSTDTRLTFLAMRNTVNTDFDGSGDARGAKKRLELTGLKAAHELSPSSQLDARISQSNVNRTFDWANDSNFTKTRLREYGIGLNHELAPNLRTRLALDRLEERYDRRYFRAPSRSTNALSGVADARLNQHLLNLALRVEDSNRYSTKTSYAIGYGFQLDPGLRLIAGMSTGYRAPDLGDYYASPSANRLKLERNHTIEAGAQWQPTPGLFGRAVLYQSKLRDRLTEVGACGSDADCSTVNIGRARIRGLALSVGHDTHPGEDFEGLNWKANLDLIKPENLTTGRELPNVAKRRLTGHIGYGLGTYSVGADVVLTNRHFSDEANQQRVGGYLLVNLRSAWRASSDLTVFADVYNLGNHSYHTHRHYNQQPRTFMVGVSYAPR
ncbi:MAG: TonB-dependent receptor [Lautropia sp.]|nr:TonB-dependent receptor [Lautropia sp.]